MFILLPGLRNRSDFGFRLKWLRAIPTDPDVVRLEVKNKIAIRAMELYKELSDPNIKFYNFVQLEDLAPRVTGTKKKKQRYQTFGRQQENADQDDYVEILRQRENKRLIGSDPYALPGPSARPSRLMDVECASTVFTKGLPVHDLTARFDFRRPPSKLLVAHREKEILAAINSCPSVVIQGPTGCGKTTQVPQFVLDQCIGQGRPVNIVVTQPRRIAAISVAKRVSEERNWPLGSLVGYKIGMKSSISADTRVMFCTTGVLLQHLIKRKTMNDFTHVIIDEVHERDQEMDFLLLIVRKMLRSVSSQVKVILMSATINSEKFSEYFCFSEKGKIQNAPVVSIGGSIYFPVQIYHLEEIEKMVNSYNLNIPLNCKPKFTVEMRELIVKIAHHLDRLEMMEGSKHRGSVLIFLPGIHEIEDTYEELKNSNNGDLKKWRILPLHSSITRDEQMHAFAIIPPQLRKIILSTNISESSITVPDVKYVIDVCLTKHVVTNMDTNFSYLDLQWASKVNCQQRTGRVGRVAPGMVFRIVPRMFYESFVDEQLPEMQRCSLSKLVLMAKMLDCGDEPKELLGLALDPPKLHNIESTILNLKELGGLLVTHAGKVSTSNGDITFLGSMMANLPIDIPLTRLIVLGQIFGVYENSLIIASAMYVRNMLANPFKEKLDAYVAKMNWAAGSGSDGIALLNAYKNWKHKKETGYFERNISGTSHEEEWSREFFVQVKPLREVMDLIEEMDGRLKKIGFVPRNPLPNNTTLTCEQEILLLKVVMAGAFYPNYFIGHPKYDDGETARIPVDFDVCSTVILTKFPLHQPGEIYTEQVKKLLAQCSQEMRLAFDGTTKIHVEFSKDSKLQVWSVPSQSPMAVYKAVKVRQFRHKLVLKILPEVKAANFLHEKEASSTLSTSRSSTQPELPWHQPVLPRLSTKLLRLKVTHVLSPSQFYVRSERQDHNLMIRKVTGALNGPEANLTPLQSAPVVGKVYAVADPFSFDSVPLLSRVRVTELLPPNECQVNFVDLGIKLNMSWDKILELGAGAVALGALDFPFLAVECRLAEIGPSNSSSWSAESASTFKELAQGQSCIGEIYSVVEGVYHLQLSRLGLSINEELVKKGHAIFAIESAASRENHMARANVTELSESQAAEIYNNQYPPAVAEALFCDADFSEEVDLRGPYSPLEIQLQHLTRSSLHLPTNVEKMSVNSVILSDDTLDKRQRFVVAGKVSTSQGMSRMTLRDTTLMPPVPGMLPLVCMLFSPRMEPRTKAGVDHFTGMLCGLGYNSKTKVPLYPEHDMEVICDVAFNLEDLAEVNRLRFWINAALAIEKDASKPGNGPKEILLYQQQTQKILLGLLAVERQKVEPILSEEPYRWNRINKEFKVYPAKMYSGDSDILPLHWGAVPKSEESRTCRKMKRALADLEALAIHETLPSNEVVCKLCSKIIYSTDELPEHLSDDSHEEVQAQSAKATKN